MKAILTVLALLWAIAPAQAGDIRPFGRGDWARLSAAQAGRPAVVHFWSLTCAPCLAELPAWAAFAKRHPGIELILVATDPVAQAPKLAAILARAGLGGAQSWAFDGSLAERLRFEIDPDWMGELPHTARLDAAGRAAFRTGSLTEDGLSEWIISGGGVADVHRAHH
ncbi:TlpA family protein disulfide reductase [Magnetospirillum moscoviense]|uniref:TlpA family protein disulfide reductase n=1 Tax=Magnetospirillum moscoviense TaxID=1437059 RepID=UPI0008399C2D|nr:hypothetical protein [Magnetospirillum moscoviense]